MTHDVADERTRSRPRVDGALACGALLLVVAAAGAATDVRAVRMWELRMDRPNGFLSLDQCTYAPPPEVVPHRGAERFGDWGYVWDQAPRPRPPPDLAESPITAHHLRTSSAEIDSCVQTTRRSRAARRCAPSRAPLPPSR